MKRKYKRKVENLEVTYKHTILKTEKVLERYILNIVKDENVVFTATIKLGGLVVLGCFNKIG